MRGINDVHLRQLDGMTLGQIIDFLQSRGYDTVALSNEELYVLADSLLQDMANRGDRLEEINFSDDR